MSMEQKDQIFPSETSNALPKADLPHMMEAPERLLSLHQGDERRLKRKVSDVISGSPPVAPSGRRGRKPVASHGVRESGEGSRRGGRGRGRGSRGGRSSTTGGGGGVVQSGKKEEEYVCFVCLDGGDLVVCDQRKCPKVYHPDCINRDESYLQSKGDWYCGFPRLRLRLIPQCMDSTRVEDLPQDDFLHTQGFELEISCLNGQSLFHSGWHMCNKCRKSAPHKCYTCVFSLCKECLNQAEFVRVRGDKGFCTTCMNMVMTIELADAAKKSDGVDFYFKDYYLDLKEKLFLTFEELAKATSSDSSYGRNNSSVVHEPSSDNSSGNFEAKLSARKESNKCQTSYVNEENSIRMTEVDGKPGPEDSGWASKELIEFIEHMKDGDRSALSQFEIQDLLYKHIVRHNLLDPSTKSDILCDSILQNLFGKTRIGFVEMLQLLKSHFLKNEPSPEKNLDEYSAIDMQNMRLVTLRRNMLEDLLDNIGTFNDKVIGSFVRIRISDDGYRLVQVVGICKAAENYKSGEKETDVLLEILNLNEKEFTCVNFVSNQEFSKEECKQLRQSIKDGLVGRLKLGDVQEKAGILTAVRVNDRIRREKLRLGKLRNHAIEQGCAEQECLEKLEVLSTPQELMRRLNEVPEIHADPKMDPNYGSSDDEGKTEHERQGNCGHSIESIFVERREGTYLGRGDCIPANNQDKSPDPAACTDIIPYLNKGKDKLQENCLVPQSAHAIEESLKDAGHQENSKTDVSAEMIPSTFVSCKSSLGQGKKEQKNNSLAVEDTRVIASRMTYTRETRNLALREPFFAESGREATYIGKRNYVPSNTSDSAQKSIQTAWENKNKENVAFTEISPSNCVSYGKYGSFLNQGTKEQQANNLTPQSAQAIEESLNDVNHQKNTVAVVSTDLSPFALVSCRSPLNQERREHQENCLAIEESLKGGVSNTNQLATMTEKHREPAASTDLNPSIFVSCPSSLDQENCLVIEEKLKNDASNFNKLAVNSETIIIAAQKTNETERLWHYQDPTGKVQGPFAMIQLQKWSKTGLFPATLRIWKVSDRQEESILLIDALKGKFLL